MMIPKISIYMDHVDIDGTTVPRPSRISRGEWIQYWETVTRSTEI